MQDFEAGGSPPPPTRPPPPPTPPGTGPPAPPYVPAAMEPSRDNPIAVAGLIVSLLALILSIVVIGFVVGIVSLVLCIIGLRRARRDGLRGRGLAITGIGLSVLSMVLSILGVLLIASLVRSLGDDTIRDGIATTSSNTADPPQDDLDQVDCLESNTGLVATARVMITNRSQQSSVYQITVVWDSPSGTIEEELTTGYVGVDESRTLTAVDLSGNADTASCRVSRIERSILPFF